MAATDRMQRYSALALDVLRRELGPFVVSTEVREDDDHGGEPSLYFVAMLDDSAPLDLSNKFADAQVALRVALEGEGEMRFPYLQTRRPAGFALPEDYFLRIRSELARKRAMGR